MWNFREKVAWITGASSGIGEALSRELVARGAFCILSARREEKLAKLQKELGPRTAILPLDVTQIKELPEKTQKAQQLFGRVDILVNNAGITQRALACQTELSVVRQIFEVNFFAVVALTQLVLPEMLERKSGVVLVISSLAGKVGTPWRSTYSGSKHALHGYFDSLRAEVAPHSVQVTLACPGFVKTEISYRAVRGDGSLHGKLDRGVAHGMPPRVCAKRVLDGVAQGKEEVIVAGKERFAVTLKHFFPKFFSWLIQRLPVT